MIVQVEGVEGLFVVNVGRPTYFNDDHFAWWDKFFAFVETTPMEIVANAIYPMMREYCEQRQKYGGNGFAFNFWMKSQEDADHFTEVVKAIK